MPRFKKRAEMARHCSVIVRDKDPVLLSCDSEDLAIRQTMDARVIGGQKVHRRLHPQTPGHDVLFEVGVR